MSTVNPVSIAPAAQSPDDKKPSNDVLGKDAFMKLLVEQLRNQSPDNSSDPNAFINQMTQFSILEQLQNQSTNQQQQNAAGLLGRTVSYLDDDNHTVEGVVEAVDYSGGVPTLTVAGQVGIAPAKVFKVR
jgi:flagellar basal-body rod modification protein FlgD